MNIPAAESQLCKILDCAQAAAVHEEMFLGFGTMLGIVREGGLISTDNDTDVCIFGDKISSLQEGAFYSCLAKAGLFSSRHAQARREDTGRLLWISLKAEKKGTKSCIWFWYPWQKYYWHSKGRDWVRDAKFPVSKFQYSPDSEALMKGIPAKFVEKTICVEEILGFKYLGRDFRISRDYGSCLDIYYPGWLQERPGETSERRIVAEVPKWADQSTWRVISI